MKVYDFGANEAPAFEENGKAFAQLIELNTENSKNEKIENNIKKSLEQFCKDLQGILY